MNPSGERTTLWPRASNKLKSRLQNGFHPYTLQLSNGRGFGVPPREFIALHPKGAVVFDPDGISHTINPLRIVSTDVAVQEE